MKFIAIGTHLRAADIEPLAAALPAGSLFVSGLSVPDDQPLSDREVILQAATLRGQLLERATFVAIRYGLAVPTAEEAERRIRPHLENWLTVLERHRDDVEMTLKVAANAGLDRPMRQDFNDGAAYMRALHESVRSASIDPEFRSVVESRIVPLSIRHRWTNRDDASVELATLIPRSALGTMQAEGEALRRQFPSVPFMLSGPWPLEVFADADHE